MQAKGVKTDTSLTILLADDSPNIHKAVALGLRKEPYELVYCDNGQDALRILREKLPQIALLDLDMPGPTGAELVQIIKKDSRLLNTKVILLCSSFDQVDETHLDSLPADGRIWKPFEAQVLITLITNILSAGPKKQPVKQSAEATSVDLPKMSASATSDLSDDLMQNLTKATFHELEHSKLHEPEGEKTRTGVSEDILDKLNPDAKISLHEPESPQEITWMGSAPVEEKMDPREEEAQSLWDNRAELGTSFYDIPSDKNVIESQEATIAIPSRAGSVDSIKNAARDENTLRAIVREEIQTALRSWFKEQLQNELDSVIKEIDREP